jgi:hypothetical protein
MTASDAIAPSGAEHADAAPFPSLLFFELVCQRLNDSPAFSKATAWWDGSILLKLGDDRLWMKWYKGRVIDVHSGPSPLGYTFALGGPTDVWQQLLAEPLTSVRSWARFLVQGAISPEGNIFEFRRMSVGIYLLVDEMRAVYSSGESAP